jgi:hypothetical protein
MTRTSTDAERLALEHSINTLLVAATAKMAVEIVRATDGVISDARISAYIGTVRLMVLEALDQVAPERLSQTSRARLKALAKQAERSQPS